MYQDQQQNLQNPMVNPQFQFQVQQPQQNMQQPFPPQQSLDSQQNQQNLQAPLVNPQFQQKQAQFVQPLPQQQKLEKDDYKIDFCSCCEDINFFMVGFCIGHIGLAILHAFAVSKATEKQTGCCLALLLELVCCPCINRSTIRKAYNIEGSLCEDILLFVFCAFCAYLQDINEVSRRSGGF